MLGCIVIADHCSPYFYALRLFVHFKKFFTLVLIDILNISRNDLQLIVKEHFYSIISITGSNRPYKSPACEMSRQLYMVIR